MRLPKLCEAVAMLVHTFHTLCKSVLGAVLIDFKTQRLMGPSAGSRV